MSSRTRNILIWAGLIIGFLLLLEAAHALKPFAWAIITAYLLHPLVSFIQRKTGLPKHLITAWLYVMLALVISLLIINFAPPLIDETKDLQDDVPAFVDRLQTWVDENADGLQDLGIDPDNLQERLGDAAAELASGIGTEALPLLLDTAGIAIQFLVYLVSSFYFIVYGDKFVGSLKRMLNTRFHGEFDHVMTDINTTLGAYIRGQALLVLIMSTASYIALYIFDVKYALIIAIATGFLELIPIVGPWTAGTIAVSVALFQDTAPFGWSNTTLAIAVGLTYFVLRQLEDAFVIPVVIGRIVHIHPLLVIFVVVVGTAIGGILGLVLAVPVSAALKIVLQYLYGKIIARDTRHIEHVVDKQQLQSIAEEFPDIVNATKVLLIEPGLFTWSDMDAIIELVEAAYVSAIALSVITSDSSTGALFTAAGVDTTMIAGDPNIAPSPAPAAA